MHSRVALQREAGVHAVQRQTELRGATGGSLPAGKCGFGDGPSAGKCGFGDVPSAGKCGFGTKAD